MQLSIPAIFKVALVICFMAVLFTWAMMWIK